MKSCHFVLKSVEKCGRTSHAQKRAARTHIAHTFQNDFRTHLRNPCLAIWVSVVHYHISGLLCIAIVPNCQWRTIINLLCLFILCKHTKGAKLLTIDCLFSRDQPQKAIGQIYQNYVKFIYSEATEFCEISILLLAGTT